MKTFQLKYKDTWTNLTIVRQFNAESFKHARILVRELGKIEFIGLYQINQRGT